MKILLTGSEGLIGSELRPLLDHYEVVRFDSTLGLDTRNASALEPLIKDCAGIVHLAAVSRVVWGENDPETCWDVNVRATENLVKMALQAPQKPWFIFASSREVYGQQEKLPVIEDVHLKPMNVYARSKVAGEEIVNQAIQEGLKATIVRFSNVFGRADDHIDRVIPAFCRAAIKDDSLRIDGQNHTFDFTYVKDVVRGVASLIELMKCESAPPPIHFTSGRGITLGEAASLICNTIQSKSKCVEGTPRNFDVSAFVGNNNRARSILGWLPETPFEKGVAEFMEIL